MVKTQLHQELLRFAFGKLDHIFEECSFRNVTWRTCEVEAHAGDA